MRRLIVSEFVTLDGVIEAPGFEEHRDGRNAWALRIQDPETSAYNAEISSQADALLLGRTTYQIWAAFWPTAGGDDGLKRRMNEIPKYVASRTMKEAPWGNTTILSADLASEVAELKRQRDGYILVLGSADVAIQLMKHDLVDEWWFQVFPVVLGSGKRLFPDGLDTRHMRLVRSRVFAGSGVVLLVYQPGEQALSNPFLEDYAWTDEQVRSLHAAQDADRVLATILFTDIVDSTARAAALGDRAWRQLLDRHDQLARTEVERWHGQLVKSTGDGILATFDTPTRALRCAFGLAEALSNAGLEIRAAIHTGEVELRAGDLGGIGVHIASRALAQAGAGKVVVTRTVRDLATGTDLRFEPMGSVGLRGIPGQWELFEASLG